MTISGFVLYLPSASQDLIAPKRLFREYFSRRARRLLPAWYASLIFTVLLFSLMAHLHLTGGLTLAQSWKSLIWHGTFLHSWNSEQLYSLNSALWMMGFEWQLSLCLPLFLALVRRCGWFALYVLAGVLMISYPGRWGHLPRFLFSAELTLPFLMGVGAARIARRPDLFFRGTRTRWIYCCLLFTCVAGFLLHVWSIGAERGNLASHSAAMGVAAGIIYLTYFPSCWPQRFLSHPTLCFVGKFSYSLFLLHVPLLILFRGLCIYNGLLRDARFYQFAFFGFPLILGISYGFYGIFERPTQPKRLSSSQRH